MAGLPDGLFFSWKLDSCGSGAGGGGTELQCSCYHVFLKDYRRCLNDLDLPFSLLSILGVFLQLLSLSQLLTAFWGFLLSKMQYKTSLAEAKSFFGQHYYYCCDCHPNCWLEFLLSCLLMAAIPMALLV